MENAPDLSLRGRLRPWQSRRPVAANVGERTAGPGDALVICTNRRQNGKRSRLVIARAFAPMAISPTRSGQCRGADSRARRRTCNLYKPPSKWQTLPTCHCEERSDVAISQYYVGYHESSGENVTAFPRLHPKGTSSRFALRAPRPLRGLAMTNLGALRH